MPTQLTGGPLTAEQVDQFNREGYLVFPAAFDADEVRQMSDEADRILAYILNASIAVGSIDPRLDAMESVEHPGVLDVRKLQPVKDLSETFRRLTEDERLLGPMRQIMGSEPILMEEKLNYKQLVQGQAFLDVFPLPKSVDRFYLHHDWGYFRQQGYPPEILSSAIAIDENTHESGPLRVIPGTHLKEWPLKDPDPMSGNGQVVEGLFGEDDMVELTCPAGTVMVFHSMLLHDSLPNTTGKPRRLMIYSHYPGSYSFPEDERNGRNRELGRALEAQYEQKRQAGWQDMVKVP